MSRGGRPRWLKFLRARLKRSSRGHLVCSAGRREGWRVTSLQPTTSRRAVEEVLISLWRPEIGHMRMARSCAREVQTGHYEKVLHWEGGQSLEQVPQGNRHSAKPVKNSRGIWMTILVMSCEKQGVRLDDLYGSPPTWDSLWFHFAEGSMFSGRFEKQLDWIKLNSKIDYQELRTCFHCINSFISWLSLSKKIRIWFVLILKQNKDLSNICKT